MIILIEILKIILYAIYSVFIKSVSYLVSLFNFNSNYCYCLLFNKIDCQ